ncbi:MAG: hypothetical protein AAB834_08225, partial [Patescibacteria group bacterium]
MNLSISIAGNWTNSATFTSNTGIVTFDAAAAQTISGSTTWNNLTIDNTAADPGDAADVEPSSAQTVTGLLYIKDGQWTPYNGDSYKYVSIEVAGIIKPASGSIISVSGDWTNWGTFTNNSGTVNFSSSSTQEITDTAAWGGLQVSGSNVNLNCTASATSVTVNSGGVLYTNLYDLTAGSGGISVSGTLDASPHVVMSDDFNNGSVDSNIWRTANALYSGSLVQESAGVLKAISTASNSGFIYSKYPYRVKNAIYKIRVAQISLDGGFKISKTYGTSNWPQWDIYSEPNAYNMQLTTGGVVTVDKVKGGSRTNPASSPALTAPYWLRMRTTDSKIYFEYSTDDSTWNGIYNETWDINTAITDLYYVFITSYDTPTTGQGWFDDFSIAFQGTRSAITDSGNFTVNSGGIVNNSTASITVGGNWANSGTFTRGTGTVTFDSASPSTITGSTTFYNLSCVTPGKALTFEAGSVQTIEAGATWNFKGNEVGL